MISAYGEEELWRLLNQRQSGIVRSRRPLLAPPWIPRGTLVAFNITRGSKGVAGNCNGEGIPEWLEDFTVDLEIAEVPAPGDISHDSDPERPVKVASRERSIFLTSQKTKIAKSASEPRLRWLLAEGELEIQYFE